MSLMLSIYLLAGFLFVILPLLLKGAAKAFMLVLFFPAIPFFTAYQIRKEKPATSALIYSLWGCVYALTALMLLATSLAA